MGYNLHVVYILCGFDNHKNAIRKLSLYATRLWLLLKGGTNVVGRIVTVVTCGSVTASNTTSVEQSYSLP